MPQLVADQTVLAADFIDGPVSQNGKYHAYISPVIGPNNDKAVEATLQVKSLLPNRQGLGKALVQLVLEREDDAGNFHPIHTLYSPISAIEYDETENGGIIPDQALSLGPQIFNFDGQVSIDASDGVNIISQDHQKRGVMPSKFRFCVVVHERAFGQTGAFESLTFSLDYELRAG